MACHVSQLSVFNSESPGLETKHLPCTHALQHSVPVPSHVSVAHFNAQTPQNSDLLNTGTAGSRMKLEHHVRHLSSVLVSGIALQEHQETIMYMP